MSKFTDSLNKPLSQEDIDRLNQMVKREEQSRRNWQLTGMYILTGILLGLIHSAIP